MQTKVLAFVGRAGAGKDTAAGHVMEFFKERPGLKVEVRPLSFAAPLKEALAALFGVPPQAFEDRAHKELRLHPWDRSPRELCQWLGTNLREQFSESFLVERLEVEIEKERETLDENQTLLVVVTDTRYPNEAQRLAGAHDAKLVLLDADQRLQRGPNDAMHSSESGVYEHACKRTPSECIICTDPGPVRVDWCKNSCIFTLCLNCLVDACHVEGDALLLSDIALPCVYCRKDLPVGPHLPRLLATRKQFARCLRHRSRKALQAILVKQANGRVGIAHLCEEMDRDGVHRAYDVGEAGGEADASEDDDEVIAPLALRRTRLYLHPHPAQFMQVIRQIADEADAAVLRIATLECENCRIAKNQYVHDTRTDTLICTLCGVIVRNFFCGILHRARPALPQQAWYSTSRGSGTMTTNAPNHRQSGPHRRPKLRTAPPSIPAHHAAHVDTHAEHRGPSPDQRLMDRVFPDDVRERRLFTRLRRFVDATDSSERVYNRVSTIIRNSPHVFTCRGSQAMVAAAIVVVRNELGHPVTLSEIEAATGVKKLSKQVAKFCALTDISQRSIAATNLSQARTRLGLSFADEKEIGARTRENIKRNGSVGNVTVLALTLFNHLGKDRSRLGEIAAATGTSRVTLLAYVDGRRKFDFV
ncbi:Hypothetical Protein FCC1311_086022 [Hondaea fermentalgiana]|uniref:Uncharacterized protein n=1 Tax=Hondaea fermentalgiana TaxID=2315210 RepID=A0A2R5GNA5_9STRA|nr:Hypothetical Protein FCC1311_086022 [Hondaea fermentalgiana]|eukprot:GBG32377.1 Hypothetical Protein FCC1311_086022 [Hondaea fermentalgiana]